MTPAPPPTSRSLTAFAYLVRGAVKPPSLLELRQGLSAVRGRPARSRQPLCWAIVGVPSLLLLTLIPVYFHTRASPPETSVVVTQIEGGELLDGGYVSETGHSGIKLRFNEGSRFDLEPGSRGRLRVIPPEGTRLSLERGTVECRIREHDAHRWSVEAGPFVVTVGGSSSRPAHDFTVVWDPAQQNLAVSPRRGRVAVSGPFVGDELALRPSQTLSVSLTRKETVIKEAPAVQGRLADLTSQAPSLQ